MKIVVVGSGASGVHFALTALLKGHEVVMLDVGIERPPAVLPDSGFQEIKEVLDDPLEYFIGGDFEGVVNPGNRSTFYGFPPSRTYVFARPERFDARTEGITPYLSFARGGLAEAWTAGVYPFSDSELEDYPFDYEEIRPAYAEVAQRIGISACRDDLERFIPFDADYLDPLEADEHSRHLLAAYDRRRTRLNRRGWYMGRSRVATLSENHRGRRACDHLGRCFWGCPRGSIYSPEATLAECLTHSGFEYRAGQYVTHFEYDGAGRVTGLCTEEVQRSRRGSGAKDDAQSDGKRGTNSYQTLTAKESGRVRGDLFVLAAGALMSSKIVLDSIYRNSGEIRVLEGLMDNRQVHVPFLTLSMIGKPVDLAAYQYHHVAFGLEADEPHEYVHGQITTLKAASIHPIVQALPLDLRSAVRLFRSIRAGLGVANVNFHDTRRPESHVTVEPIEGGTRTRLVLNYVSAPNEKERVQSAVSRVKKALLTLGAVVPPGLTRVLPKGTSAHYSGTLPMSNTPRSLSTSPDGTMYEFPNLCIADGATFPFLPAKNHTFTLMANSVRIAERLL